MKQTIAILIAIAIAGCTQVDTEAVGGRLVEIETWPPDQAPGCRPVVKRMSWKSQTDIADAELSVGENGGLHVRLGSTASSAEIAAAMARVAEIQIEAQGQALGELVTSDVLALIVRAARGGP